MSLDSRPGTHLSAGRKALLWVLCLVSLATPLLAPQPDGLAPVHDGQPEITWEACADEEADSFVLNSCWPSARQSGRAGRRSAEGRILAHSPTLRPDTPPPEIFTQA